MSNREFFAGGMSSVECMWSCVSQDVEDSCYWPCNQWWCLVCVQVHCKDPNQSCSNHGFGWAQFVCPTNGWCVVSPGYRGQIVMAWGAWAPGIPPVALPFPGLSLLCPHWGWKTKPHAPVFPWETLVTIRWVYELLAGHPDTACSQFGCITISNIFLHGWD